VNIGNPCYPQANFKFILTFPFFFKVGKEVSHNWYLVLAAHGFVIRRTCLKCNQVICDISL
jgi:hypothetical protein